MTNLAVKTKQEDWAATMELLCALYPRWQASPEQFASWKDGLGMLNQDWLREAIKLMYHKWTGEQPKPKWAMESFKEVQAGHTGIALTEYGSAETQRQQVLEEREQHEQQCARDRATNWKLMTNMDAQERTTWATKFIERFPMLSSERNDPTNMETWSKTFCSFVCAFRRIELKLT